jgi:hypothetical protein
MPELAAPPGPGNAGPAPHDADARERLAQEQGVGLQPALG